MVAVVEKPNGNANGNAVRPVPAVEQDEENIFLFVPNLIGPQSLFIALLSLLHPAD